MFNSKHKSGQILPVCTIKYLSDFDLTDMAAMTHSLKQKHRSFLFTAWGLSWIFYAQSNRLHAPSSISIFFICSPAWLSEKIHRSRSGEITMKRKGSCFTNLTNGMLRKLSYAERVLVGSKTPPARGTQRRFPPKHTENTIYF